MSYFSDLAIEHEKRALKNSLVRDSEMVKIALNLALRNTSILFHNIEKNRGYGLDCQTLDNIEQKIQNIIDEIESLSL